MSHAGNLGVQLSTGSSHVLVCVTGDNHTIWTIEPRGNSYVSALNTYRPCDSLTHQDRIGNAGDATAIHLIEPSHGVSLFMFQSRTPD